MRSIVRLKARGDTRGMRIAVFLLAAAACSSTGTYDGPPPEPPPADSVAFHIAQADAAPNYLELATEDGTIFVDPQPFATLGDVLSVRPQRNASSPDAPLWQVVVIFATESHEQIAGATAQNRGKRIAVLSQGTLVAAPAIEEPVTNGRLVIDEGYTRSEAEHLAHTIAGRMYSVPHRAP